MRHGGYQHLKPAPNVHQSKGSDLVRRAKLHMVDLAGSERAHKTGATGQTLREATYINQRRVVSTDLEHPPHTHAHPTRGHQHQPEASDPYHCSIP